MMRRLVANMPPIMRNGGGSNRCSSTWQPNGPGRPPRDRRQIVNGLLYLTKTGCPLENGV